MEATDSGRRKKILRNGLYLMAGILSTVALCGSITGLVSLTKDGGLIVKLYPMGKPISVPDDCAYPALINDKCSVALCTDNVMLKCREGVETMTINMTKPEWNMFAHLACAGSRDSQNCQLKGYSRHFIFNVEQCKLVCGMMY